MFEIMLFLHLTGLVIWFGSLMVIAFVIMLSKRPTKSNETRSLIRRAIRIMGWVAHPTSILVLVSGIVMIVEMNFGDTPKPLWLTYMERGGGTIVLLAIVLTALFGSRIVKRLGATENAHSEVAVRGGVYFTSLIVIIAAILSVILVVSLRL